MRASIPTWSAAAGLVLGAGLVAPPAGAVELPIPCAPCNVAGAGPLVWVSSGTAALSGDASHMVITAGTSAQPNVVLNWQSFNISADGSVQFIQPNATAIALNRIFQNDPSRIYGALSANGQVYLINQNGILFGNPDGTPMQLNVQSLVASTLPMQAGAVSNGILAPIASNQAAFSGTGSGVIQVASGATLKSADGGRIALFAPSIANAGHIETPDGQALLAAGHSIYLQSSDDPNLRGLLVEVSGGGDVTNTGSILAQQGNITLMGLAVNQSGRVTATTTASKAGTISLLAHDGVAVQVQSGGRHVPVGTGTGSVEFGAGSVTEVTLDTNGGETAVDDQPQPVSTVTVDGKQIHMASDSAIVAHGGTVAMTAELNAQGAGTAQSPSNDVSIRIDGGATVDVSGGTVDVPMSRNAVTVQLRGNELRDDPQQRDGVLRGQTVVVDARVGTPLADVSGYITAGTRRSVIERLGNGGNVSLLSQGAVAVAKGATIDLSGGAVHYLGGTLDTTKLVGANGQVYDIGSAPVNITYVGLYGPTGTGPNKWGVSAGYGSVLGSNYEAAYTQGLNAGTLQVAGRTLLIGGDVVAHTEAGRYQSSLATFPLAGQLVVGLPGGKSGGGLLDYDAPSLWLGEGTPQDPAAAAIDVDRLGADGIGRFALYSDGKITLPAAAPLQLSPGSTLALTAPAIELQRSVIDHGGTVSVASTDIDPGLVLDASRGVSVAAGTLLDVSGLWTNEFNSTSDPQLRVANGGSVSLSSASFGGTLALGDGAVLDASAGGAVSTTGTLSGGKGGTIALSSSAIDSALAIGAGVDLRAYGSGTGTGSSSGGSLVLSAPSVAISGGDGMPVARDWIFGTALHSTAADPLQLEADLFGTGGFAKVSVNANQGTLQVAPGTSVYLEVASRQFDQGYLDQASGSSLARLTSVGYAPAYQRQAATLSLGSNLVSDRFTGGLAIGEGARLEVDPAGTIGLTTTGSGMVVDGSLVAHSGKVTLAARQLGTQDFDPAFALWLGSHAQLDVSGTVIGSPDGLGNTVLQVQGGGTISATSSGYLVSEAGSRLDVSGTAATGDAQVIGFLTSLYDRAGGNQRTVGSVAGAISLQSAEGMVLLGELAGHGGASGYAGGSLDLVVDRTLRTGNFNSSSAGFPAGTARITVGADALAPPLPLAPGSALDVATYNGKAYFGASQLADSGIDALGLRAAQIAFDDSTPITLALARQIALSGQQYLATGARSVVLSAPSVSLQSASRTATAGAPGAASLRVDADNIDLAGGLSFGGFGDIALHSSGDIRLRGAPDQGALASSGSLILQADRIFPATMTSFSISMADSGALPGTIDILSNGKAAVAADGLLSAGGSLKLSAADIHQAGVLEAPLGSISLEARDTLTLDAGSVTSVHASASQILLGRTLNLADWYYSASGNAALGNADQLYGPSRQAFPGKSIALSATSLSVAPGATVDYSGGGDAVAWEQIPGPGGSGDALSIANAGGMFAILPASSGYGPVDPAEFAQWGLSPGAAVTLYQPANGLPAGTYAILPPRYALLPGAFLVKPVTGYANMDPAQALSLPDGSTIVAGVSTTLNTGLQGGAVGGYVVQPGSYAYELAEYHLTSANAYLGGRADTLGLAAPALPKDAGSLSLAGQGALALDGQFLGAAAAGGKASQVDVSAANLAIVDQLDPGSQATQITAANLAALEAGSLLLGGKRSATTGGENVTVLASTVTIGDGVALSLPELLMVGLDGVRVGANAQLSAKGTSTAAGQAYFVTGDSARLLVSNARGSQIVASYAAGAASGQRGTVTVAAGATLSSSGSLVLDGARDLVLDGGLVASAGSTVSFASSHVTLGDGSASGTGGLVLDSSRLAQLAGVDLSLKGRTGIDVLAGTQVQANNLVLDAPVLAGLLGAGSDTASFNATQGLTLRNTSGTVASSGPAQTAGTLSLAGQVITVDNAAIGLQGFSQTNLMAGASMLGRGAATIRFGGSLAVRAPLLTVADGADFSLVATDANGLFRLDATQAAGGNAAGGSSLGGAVRVRAGSIEQFGSIVAQGGTIALDGAQGVTLGSGSHTSVTGVDVAIAGTSTAVAGGSVSLHSAAGDIAVQSGAAIDVSGSAGGGDAGSLVLRADSGNVTIDANALLAGSGRTATAGAGNFVLDAASLGAGSFSGLNAQLNSAGFNGMRDFRFSGVVPSVTLDAGTTLDVRGFRLVVEQGGIQVDGAINVSNPDGLAQLGLFAADTVHVGSTGVLSVNSLAKGTTEAEIDLYSTRGGITVDAGARLAAIAPNATYSGGGGIVHYRLASSQVAAGGFNVAAGTAAAGTRRLVEGYQSYVLADGQIDTQASPGSAIYQDAATFMASAPVAALRAAGFEVAPGIELTSTGDMALASTWDLSSWRFSGSPGVLTLRSAGSLAFLQSLSDGFADATPYAALGTGTSWSYDLVAGADLASANPLATRAAATDALLSVAPDVLVRTGTGDISVASAGDVALLGNVSGADPYGQGVIYTAGRSAGLELDALTNPFAPSKYLPVDGGRLAISAGRDVVGSPSNNEFTQFYSEWYRRQPDQGSEPAGLWVNYDAFQQQFAAFGGGDLSVSAGRDLVRVAASVPTTGYYDTATSSERYFGSGSLSVTAGRDIASGMFLVSNGTGKLEAGGAFTATSRGPYGLEAVGTVLAAMDTQYVVRSRGDLNLSAIVNPTAIGQVNQPDNEIGFFLSYSPTASTTLISTNGLVRLMNNGSRAVSYDASGAIPFYSAKDEAIYTPLFSAEALRGGLQIDNSMYLAPSAEGNLTLAAWGNLFNRGAVVSMSDIDPSSIPSLGSQELLAPSFLESIHTNISGSAAHAVPTLHAAGGVPATIASATGDITGGFWFVPRAATVFAGLDVRDLRFNGQNNGAIDTTRVVAGRDISFGSGNTNYGINLAGPGNLQVVAGRNIDLGPSFGIVTEGNLVNPGLADNGANITVMAGIASDIDGTLAGIPADKTLADLFLALRTAGRNVAQGLASDFQPGFDAIEKDFPKAQSADDAGSLTMVQSRIYTLDGGDINIVVPHGSVNVGVAQAAAGATTKKPSELGIVAEKAGAVRAFVDGDFLVNSSRVFTLGGGDILLWSSNGNIDAGRGAKTTISAPEPTITIDPQGNVQQNFGAAIAGSGIRGILAVKDVAPGDVDLFAPRGFVSAGDAGIGSAGNVTIAAVRVIGADNINFGGTAVGVPVDTGGLGASLASVSAASSSASNSATESAGNGTGEQGKTPLATEALSWLEVFVLGLGEDSCRPDDLDCLKRQKKSLN